MIYLLGNAQEPAFTPVFEAELNGTDIYSLLQDQTGDILLTTDQGLMRYDGYTLRSYSNADEKIKSLFGLCQSVPGKAWCFNLSGQIFSFQDDSLHLYYTLPDSLVSNMMAMAALPQGDLVVSCRGLLVIHPDRRTTLLSPPGKPSFGNGIIGLSDGSMIHVPATGTEVIHRQGKTLKIMPFAEPPPLAGTPVAVELFSSGGTHHLRMGTTFELYVLSAGAWRRLPLAVPPGMETEFPIRVFGDGEGGLWLLLLKRGLLRFDRHGRLRDQQGVIFKGHQFSCHLMDREGNLWLGTLGSGLLMLSNPDVRHYRTISPSAEEKRNRFLASDGTQHLYLGYDTGEIVEIEMDGQEHLIFSSDRQELKYLCFDPWLKKICLSVDGHAGIVDPATKEVLMSDKFLYPKTYCPAPGPLGVLPATQGLFLTVPSGHDFPVAAKKLYGFTRLDGTLAQIKGARRSHSAYFDGQDGKLYIGSAVGLHVVSSTGFSGLEWQGQPVIARAIVALDSSLWISSSQFGLLEARAGRLMRQVSAADGLLRNDIRKVVAWQGRLYLGFDRLIQVYDPASRRFERIDQASGLSGEPIVDFALLDSTLWVASKHALRALPLSQRRINTVPPLIRFTGLTVNGQPRPFAATLDLENDENQLDFSFVASGFRHQGALRYAYQLEGEPYPDWKWLDAPQHSLSYSSLRPGTYTLHVKAVNEDGIESAVISQHFRIAGPIWSRWWFILGAVLLLTTLAVLLYRMQITRIRRENALQLENERVAKALVDSHLTALRAQMNPHFIFNALNSIQEFILTNEKKQATKYLGKFADLMRTYLNHSQQKSVGLSEEIKALRLYLELENLRFDDTLEIDIDLAPTLDADAIQIPSLLIQPFVENAIKHGLFHQRRPRPRRLHVRFLDDGDPCCLRCEIEDNGIGRAAAMALQAAHGVRHASFATASARTRLDLLQRDGMSGLTLDIYDLSDADGQPAGTRVTLILPCL
jgi:hypothetical protein